MFRTQRRLARLTFVAAIISSMTAMPAADAAQNPAAPAISVADINVEEGTGVPTSAVFTLTLDKASGRIITVRYVTGGGTASSSSDYAAAGGIATFNKRQTSTTVVVPVTADSVDEPDETFELRLSDPGGGATIADGLGVATIIDDDNAPPPPSQISVGDVIVSEGNSGATPAVFQLTLDRAADHVVTVNYATGGGTATAGSDYGAAIGTVSFNAQQTTASVTVAVVGDTVDESDETLELRLSNPGGGATIADAVGVANIIDDDDPPPPPPAQAAASVQDTSLSEGNAGSTPALFFIVLDRAPGRTVTVDYVTLDETARAGEDYVFTSGRVTFGAQQTEASVHVPVLGDTVDEPDEDFGVIIGEPSEGVTIDDGVGVATIVDDDETPVDLAIELETISGSGTDYLVETEHLVHFRVVSQSTADVRDVRVRMTFDTTPSGRVRELSPACEMVREVELLCSYGDSIQGASDEISIEYTHPSSYTITATVESATPDNAPGNNSRTAVLNVRNRRTDWKVVEFGGFDTTQRIAGARRTIWKDPSRMFLPTNTPYDTYVRMQALGPDPKPAVLSVEVIRSPNFDSFAEFRSFRAFSGSNPLNLNCYYPSAFSLESFKCDLPADAAGTITLFFEIDPEDQAPSSFPLTFRATIDVPLNPDGTAVETAPEDNVLVSEVVDAIDQVADLRPIKNCPSVNGCFFLVLPDSETQLATGLENLGPAAEQFATLDVRIPAGLSFVRYGNQGRFSCVQGTDGLDTILRCTLGTTTDKMLAGVQNPLTFDIRATAPGDYQVRMTASGPHESNPANNELVYDVRACPPRPLPCGDLI